MLRSVAAAVCLWGIVTLATNAESNGYYTIVGSQQIHPYSKYHVSVSLHESTEPSVIKLTINNSAAFKMTQQVTVQPLSTETVTFETGFLPEAGDNGYVLTAEGVSGIIFRNETSLNLHEKRFTTFIQTDKAIYKPGDKIQYRVLVLDPNMRPLQLKGELNVHILDGKGNRLKQWNNLTVTNGVFANELQLSSFPVLGDWNIVVDLLGETKKKTVEVAEYVLPKFEVLIDARKEITFKDKVTATIRAKYTYGKAVRGEANATLRIKSWGYPSPDAITLQKVVKLNGKGFVEFELADLKVTSENYYQELTMDVEVTEELTGRKLNATTSINVRKTPYYFTHESVPYFFVPGKPYELKVRVVRHDGQPIPESERSLEFTLSDHYNLAESTENVTQTVPIAQDGLVVFNTVMPFNKSSMHVNARYLGENENIAYLSAAEEKTTIETLEGKLITDKPTVSQPIVIKIDSPDQMTYLTYQALGRGNILKTDTVKFDPPTNTYELTITPTVEMIPALKVVVYYLKEGKLVSTFVEVNVSEDPANAISLKASKEQAKPGEDIDLKVRAPAGSYVGLLGIDQSVLLLKSGNDLQQSEIDLELNAYSSYYYSQRSKRSFGFGGRYPSYNPNDRDFSSAGAVVLSNMIQPPIEDRDMYCGYRLCALDSVDRFDGAIVEDIFEQAADSNFEGSPQMVEVRKEFPETWIWEGQDSTIDGADSSLSVSKKVPDTITSWIITGFSLNPTTGLSLTQNPTKLQVFQPFFVSLNLPYSIKRGEIVSIPIVVFNYMDESVSADVTLHNEDQAFEFVEINNDVAATPKIEAKRSKSVDVKSNDGSAVSFLIKPNKVGPITIKVTATTPLAGDGIERILPVEPEGVPQYVNKAFFVDLRDATEINNKMAIDIPSTSVPDSARVEVTVIGDILGSTIKNLDSLIRMPYGCGEQNMLNFVPNIVVIDYLTATNQLTEAVETRAKKYMESGYQRELTYRHKDGSFSAFGESDTNGSTWLTAFVARSFRQAATHIDIEEKIIDDALQWLSNVQTENGSFPEVGNVAHTDMQGGAGKGIALTAYTLIAFVENKNLAATYKKTIDKAIEYIVKNLEGVDDIYAYALAAYALQQADHSAKEDVLQNFDAKATVSDGQKYWNKPMPKSEPTDYWSNKANSVNTEMSAYGLLTLIETKPYTEVIPIMRWLLSQRNDQGGFQSTQDTVVGLQALAKIAAKIAVTDNDIKLKVTYGEGQESNIVVNKANGLINQQYEIPKDVKEVEVAASGHGFALFQLSYKYNVNDQDESPRFKISPTVQPAAAPGILELKVCTSFIATPESVQSNMAVMEVAFPSGYTADSDSIPDLLASENVKKVETKNGDTTVIVYFDHVGAADLCPTFVAVRTHKVAKQKPAAIAVYDYYDTSRRASTFYSVEESSLCDICEGDECNESCPK